MNSHKPQRNRKPRLMAAQPTSDGVIHDGSIVPYYATSTTDKTVYRDFSALPVSEDMCIKLKQFKSKFASLSPTNNINRPMSAKVKSTQMYQISNVVHSLQYISDYGIIRIWNDIFINGDNLFFGNETNLPSLRK